MADKTPIDAGLLARAVQAVKYTLTGKPDKTWFGPGQPVAPQAQDELGARGRAFDFPVGVNTRRDSRDGESGITYKQLRALADSYGLLRLVIETRKDQMSKMKWKIKPKDEKAVPNDRCKEIQDFLAYPDQEHDWDTWLRALLEDLFVIDAPTIYPRYTLGDDLYGLELVDGSTIKRVLDETGRTPLPPQPAYQQIIKGMPATDYHRDELIYRPRNVRTFKVYGYSPVEQIVMTVNIALRREISQLQYYTEGNIPEALIGVPESWNPKQIADFQASWDMLMEGNQAQKRHMKFVPGGMDPKFTREPTLKDTFDEWLSRIVCYAFSVSPQALIAQMNRATAETAHTQALQEGLSPVMNWVKSVMDYIIAKYFDEPDLQFDWEEEDDTSPKVQSEILCAYVDKGILTDDEAREALGKDPFTDEQREKMKPPPMPGAVDENGDPIPPDPNNPTPPGAVPKEGAVPPGGDDPTKKFASSGVIWKAKTNIPRNRATVKSTIKTIDSLFHEAFKAAAQRIAAKIALETGNAHKADSDKYTIEQFDVLISTVSLDELWGIRPELIEALKKMYDDGTQTAIVRVSGGVSESQLKQVNVGAIEFAQHRAAELITDVEDSTRDMLRVSVMEALNSDEGFTTASLADTLKDNHAFSEYRSNMIARTEAAFADVEGNIEGWKLSGVVKGKQWLSAAECCDDCQKLNDVVVDLDEDFPDDGGSGPPLHPHCECDVIAVLSED